MAPKLVHNSVTTQLIAINRTVNAQLTHTSSYTIISNRISSSFRFT